MHGVWEWALARTRLIIYHFIQGHEILSQISERSDGEEEEGEGESEGEEGAMEEEMELEDNRSITNSTSTDRKSRGLS